MIKEKFKVKKKPFILDLCSGNKKYNIPKCIHSKLEMRTEYRALFAGSSVSLECKILYITCFAGSVPKPITKVKTQCGKFANRRLFDNVK